MTLRIATPELPRPLRNRRIKFHPRLDILEEVVAGLLWLQLDLPQDASRDEIEDLARHLVTRIRSDACEAAIEAELTALQGLRFCRPVHHAALRALARRLVVAVRGA